MHSAPLSKKFYWGAATASHQVEGNNQNDWSEWEKANAERLAEESQASFLWNPHWKKFRTEATNPANYLSGASVDHWNRYEEDFDIMAELGLSAYRFSIEWSRIEPTEGQFDEQAIAHYREMITALRTRHIEPFVTLWHWTLPLWVAERGGIAAPDFPVLFARYTEKVVMAFGSDVHFYITLNEPDVNAAHAYFKGVWPPQKKGFFQYRKALSQLVKTHRLAYHTIKRLSPGAAVGIAKHNVWFEAVDGKLINRFLKLVADWNWNHSFLRAIKHEQDFIGLNHYNHNRIDWGYNKNENRIQTDFGWEYYPRSLYYALTELKRYDKPIYITENGIADASDLLRQKFIPAAIQAMDQARTEGVDVRGYFYWSLLDNFEWDKGYWLRFGLIHVDRATQKRTVRDSARIYSTLIQERQ